MLYVMKIMFEIDITIWRYFKPKFLFYRSTADKLNSLVASIISDQQKKFALNLPLDPKKLKKVSINDSSENKVTVL